MGHKHAIKREPALDKSWLWRLATHVPPADRTSVDWPHLLPKPVVGVSSGREERWRQCVLRFSVLKRKPTGRNFESGGEGAGWGERRR